MRCSCSRIRSDRLSAVSSSLTVTGACSTMGPASSSGVTKCTVAPDTFTPWATACCCASSPGKAGSREGWMLSTALGNARMKSALSRRMNPARHTSVTPRSFSVDASTRSYATRSGYALCGRTRVSMPARRARSRPAASGRFEITTAIRASRRPPSTASMMACRLLPRPEMSTPIEGLDILDRARSSRNPPDDEAALAAVVAQDGKHLRLVPCIAADDHADAHVERAQHLVVAHAAAPLEEGEDRRHAPRALRNRGARALGQDPRQVLGDPTARDVRHALHELP